MSCVFFSLASFVKGGRVAEKFLMFIFFFQLFWGRRIAVRSYLLSFRYVVLDGSERTCSHDLIFGDCYLCLFGEDGGLADTGLTKRYERRCTLFDQAGMALLALTRGLTRAGIGGRLGLIVKSSIECSELAFSPDLSRRH